MNRDNHRDIALSMHVCHDREINTYKVHSRLQTVHPIAYKSVGLLSSLFKKNHNGKDMGLDGNIKSNKKILMSFTICTSTFIR